MAKRWNESADNANPVVELKLHLAAQQACEQATGYLAAEPPACGVSPLVYEPQSGLFVLFGGDHLDYLTNDLWVFDRQKMQWQHRPLERAPAPWNHKLTANGDGTLTLSGGYTYYSNTDYLGGQYLDHQDGPWSYDVAKNEWHGQGTLCPDETRVYRTGPFHPDFYFTDAHPTAMWLANAWPSCRRTPGPGSIRLNYRD